MIVISEALVLSPVFEEPIQNPIIGWQNIAEDRLTSTSEEAENPLTNLLNPATNLLWRGSPDSPEADEYLTIDLTDYLEDVDYFAIARHNFGSAGITSSIEYLDTSDSPEEWAELVAEQLHADDAPIIWRFPPAAYAGLRLRLQPGSEAPEASVLFVGKLLVFERCVQGDYTPLPFGRVANVVSGVSEAGDFLGRIITSSRSESTASFLGLTWAWVREILDPFLEVSAEQPFFFAWAPESYPDEVGYGWLDNNAQPSFNVDGYASIQLEMTGILS